MAFAGRRDGAILDSVAPAKVPGNLRSWLSTPPVTGRLAGQDRSCSATARLVPDNLVSGQESLSVTSDGAWWVAIGNKLYTGTLAGPAAKDVSLPGGAHACSVTASGASVYVAIEPKRQLLDPDRVAPIDRFRNEPGRRSDRCPSHSSARPLSLRWCFRRPTLSWPSDGHRWGLLRRCWARGVPLRSRRRPATERGTRASCPANTGHGKTTAWATGLVTSSGKRFAAACLGPASGGTTGSRSSPRATAVTSGPSVAASRCSVLATR